MDFIEDDQAVEAIGEIELGFAQPGPVRLGLQVEIEGRPPPADFEGQGGLSHLPRSQEDDRGSLLQPFREVIGYTPCYHPCNHGGSLPCLQGYIGARTRCQEVRRLRQAIDSAEFGLNMRGASSLRVIAGRRHPPGCILRAVCEDPQEFRSGFWYAGD